MGIFSNKNSGAIIGSVAGPVGTAVGAVYDVAKKGMKKASDKKASDAARMESGRPVLANSQAMDIFHSKKNPRDLLKQYSMEAQLSKLSAPQSIMGQMQDMYGRANINQGAIEQMRKDALRTGPSAWMNSELARSQAEEGLGLSSLAQTSAGQAAMARSNLAAKRGLSSGAAERLGMQSGRDALMAQQGLRAQGMLGRMGISSQDEANRMAAVQNLTGQELGYGQFELGKQRDLASQLTREQGMAYDTDRYNVGAQNQAVQGDIVAKLKALGGYDDYQMGKYTQEMMGYGADKSALAMEQNKPKPLHEQWDPTGMVGNLKSGVGMK